MQKNVLRNGVEMYHEKKCKDILKKHERKVCVSVSLLTNRTVSNTIKNLGYKSSLGK